MIYIISRTSNDGKQPCKEAYETEVPNWHERYCSEEYYNEHFAKDEGGTWRSKGTDHKCNTRKIKRLEGNKTVWVVEIKTLEELQKFIKRHGHIVMDEEEIEIYDDYRE